MASCVTWGPSPGRVMCWAPWPGSLEGGPGAPTGPAVPWSPSELNTESRGLVKPQMFRTLTQSLSVLCRELLWP